jgi:hypothetical protein
MPFVILPDKSISLLLVPGWRFRRLLRALIAATKVGEDAVFGSALL